MSGQGRAGCEVDVVDLTVAYGRTVVFRDMSLRIEPREFLTILGPSGCGKTTLLHAIAGLVPARSGSVVIAGRDVTNRRPQTRKIGLVFQQPTLFPHMTVAQNISYGLRVQRRGRSFVRERTEYLLGLVRLDGCGGRYPRELSGGQKQRVGLARALAVSPEVLLLDEPLSSLDAKLRKEMRAELKRVQLDVGGTFVMVTHDQEEALAVSDRIAVMNHGKIEQVSDPAALVVNPNSRFVAEFMGAHNVLAGRIEPTPGGPADVVRFDWGGLTVEVRNRTGECLVDRGDPVVGIVPHASVRLQDGASPAVNHFDGTVEYGLFTGTEWRYTVVLSHGQRVVASTSAAAGTSQLRRGATVCVSWPAEDVLIVPDKSRG